jgi:hypothetical protein
MPPTSVIKISGFERAEFATHLANLCKAFRVKEIQGADVRILFEVTSGSPLFAASIVRLLSLGENLRTVVETWRGQEGEEARKFAFDRELKRLDTMQSRLLYAVLILGETSVNDLAGVLDVTPKIVQRLDQTFFASLASRRFEFAREYITGLDHSNPHPGDKLRVFDGVVRLAEAGVILLAIVKFGLSALQVWWGDVEKRPVVDLTACGILSRQLNRLENMERQLANSNAPASQVNAIAIARRDLAFRGARLSA